MEKMIKIAVRILACGFFVQPVLVAIVIVPVFKGKPLAILYAILGTIGIVCIAIGIAVWKYCPKFFLGIFKRQKEVIEKIT